MAADYTPTTEQVRDGYATRNYEGGTVVTTKGRAKFDRWLAERDAERDADVEARTLGQVSRSLRGTAGDSQDVAGRAIRGMADVLDQRIADLTALVRTRRRPLTMPNDSIIEQAARVLWDEAENGAGRERYSWDDLTERAAAGEGDYGAIRESWLAPARALDAAGLLARRPDAAPTVDAHLMPKGWSPSGDMLADIAAADGVLIAGPVMPPLVPDVPATEDEAAEVVTEWGVRHEGGYVDDSGYSREEATREAARYAHKGDVLVTRTRTSRFTPWIESQS